MDAQADPPHDHPAFAPLPAVIRYECHSAVPFLAFLLRHLEEPSCIFATTRCLRERANLNMAQVYRMNNSFRQRWNTVIDLNTNKQVGAPTGGYRQATFRQSNRQNMRLANTAEQTNCGTVTRNLRAFRRAAVAGRCRVRGTSWVRRMRVPPL